MLDIGECGPEGGDGLLIASPLDGPKYLDGVAVRKRHPHSQLVFCRIDQRAVGGTMRSHAILDRSKEDRQKVVALRIRCGALAFEVCSYWTGLLRSLR